MFERYGRDTGSSRLMNLLDWTGSFTHWESGPAIIGALNSWWTHPLAVCFADEAWNMTACEWDMELTDVGSIWWDIADLTTTDGWSTEGPNPAPTIGWLAHFGTEGSADPPIPITEHPLYSGFTGQAGWFAYYDAGSPEVIDFKDIQIRKGQFVLYASNYPVGTTFDVSVSQAWGSSDTFHVPLVSASEIFSSSEAMGPAEDMRCPNLRSCDAFAPCFTETVGPAYHVDDSGNLYIRFVDMHHYVRGLSLEDTDFTRDGTSLPRIEQQFQWALRASCPDATRTTTANNAFCSASATIPNPMNFGPPPAPPSPPPTPPPEPPSPPTIPALQSFTVEAETAGTTVTFPTAYASTPVVVCTVIHQDGWDVPVVSSLSTSGFVVSLLTSSRTVHCIAAKSGSSTMESDGIELEAFTVSVPSVSRKNSYILEEVAWPRSMANPVVVGQAYASSATVPRPTAFYSASVDKIWNPPVATQASFRVGTLQGECSDAESGPTTVGVIITPKGSYDLSDGTRVAAVVTRDRFVGANKKAKRASAAELADLRGDGAPLSVAMSPAAIDGGDGYAAVLAAVPTSSRVTAFALEDTCGDSEMWHVSEQIALLMMEAPATAARRLEDRREPMRT